MKRILLWLAMISLVQGTIIAQGSWAPIASFANKRAGSISLGIGNKGYVGLGVCDTGYLNDLWEYDPLVNSWSSRASMPAPGRQAGIAFTINGKLYAGLGIAQFTVYDDIYEFDPAANTWTPKASFAGGPKYGAMAFSIGSKGYVVGGKDPGFVNGTNDVWEFDPIANTWTQMSGAGPVLRSFGIGFSLNGKGYVGLGMQNYDTRKKDIWEFDPDFNSWTQKRDFPVERYGALCFTIGHRAYAGAGYDYSPFSDFYEYNAVEDLWTPVADVGGEGRGQGTAFSIGDKGYAGLGYNSEGYLSDVYEFRFPRTPAVLFDPISVTTIAGSGLAGFGEGGFQDGPGVSARFSNPVDVAVDPVGNVYVADQYNNRIRKISVDGIVSTYAGSGIAGYADGNAPTAQFNSPRGLAIDSLGNVYVAEENGHRIRKVNTAGIVSTVAGNGVAGYLDGPALNSQFNRPIDVAVDGDGNLYVADYENQRIRKISTDGTVSTWAGSGAMGEEDGQGSNATFAGPQTLAFDRAGSLYVIEIYGRLRKISGKGVVSKIQVPGLIDAFQEGVATDKYGNVYVSVSPAADRDVIFKISPNGYAAPLAGEFAGYKDTIGIYAKFYYAIGLTTDKEGNLFAADAANHRVRKLAKPLLEFSASTGTASVEQSFSVSAVNLTNNATLSVSAGFEISLTQGGPFSSSLFISPLNGEINLVPVYVRMQPNTGGNPVGVIAFSSDGAETQFLPVKGKVIKPALLFDPFVVTTYAGSGTAGFLNGSSATARFNEPADIARDSLGNIYVADSKNNRIRRISPSGFVSTFAGSGLAGYTNGNAATARFNGPNGVAVDRSGNVYVTESGNRVIRKISPGGIVTTYAGSGLVGFVDGPSALARFVSPTDLVADKAGNVFVVDQGANAIRKITTAGQVITIAGNGTEGEEDGLGMAARFIRPQEIALDPYDNLWVTQLYGPERKITPEGLVTTVRTEGFFGFRFGVVSDPESNIYISSWISDIENMIYKKTPSNAGALVAGGINGFKDSTGSEARFSFPEGLTIDGSGNLYVADVGNNRIRKISIPRLNFLSTAGMPSAEQMFIVSGVNLGDNLSIAVPSAFEIAVTSGGGYSSSLSLTPTSGEVISVPVYLRLKGTAAGGFYNGFITLSSPGAANKTLRITGRVVDNTPPQIECPPPQSFCFHSNNIYLVPPLKASDVSGIRSISYAVTGTTNRNGYGANATGYFNPGISTIWWRVTDNAGNASTCTTVVTVNRRLLVSIPDVYPLSRWGKANTIYKGLGPACAILVATPTGGTPYAGSAGYKYSWSTGATTPSISVCPPDPGTYTYSVTVTDALGCLATASKTITVVDIRCGSNEITICWNGASQSCYSTWQAIIALYHGAKPGPCGQYDVQVQPQVNKKELVVTPQTEMKIFPNPNKGSFTLQLTNLEINEIRVLDQNGKLIKRQGVNNVSKIQTLNVNLGFVANGIYLVQAIGKNGIYTAKVLVE